MGYAGYFDSVNNGIVEGWIMDMDNPNQIIYVDIYDYGQLVATIPANNFREDLLLNGIGNGHYSFKFSIHSGFLEDKLHFISVKVSGTSIHLGNSPKWYPSDPVTLRKEVAKKYIRGKGIEIGALHNPLPVHEIDAIEEVKYVDRYNVEGLRKHYPELNNLSLVNVDIIDDGEKLDTIDNNSLDFIICNHMLEHCENPIGTIRNHIKKLKSGGVLFMAIPDKRYTFDKNREITSFTHLLKDDQVGTEQSRRGHFWEWTVYVNNVQGDSQIQESIAYLMAMNYSIHFHVWDEYALGDFLHRTCEYLGHSFDIQFFELNSKYEVLTILTKK